MSDDVKIYLIVQTSIRIVIDISFLVLYLLRIYKLDRMASNSFHQKPKSIKFKIFLLTLLQLIFITHIALAYTDQSYWVYPYQNFTLISIAQIINCLLQIYITRKQYKKKALKVLKIPILWILWLILDISTIVFVEIKIPNTTIILIIFEAMIFVALIVIGCFLQQKNDQRDDYIGKDIKQRQVKIINKEASPNSPLIPQSRKNSRILSQNQSQMHDSNKIYIEFNKQFNISMKGNQDDIEGSIALYEFKFVVFVGQQSHILTKSQNDFINLITQMIRIYPQSEQLLIQQKKTSTYSNMTKYGQQKQKVYETYLIKLSQNQKYYTNFLLDFLQINPYYRTKLNKRKQKQIYQKKQSLPNQQQQKHKKPFFNVSIVNNKIHISNQQILQITLNKSKSQIQKFHNKLIAQKKLKMQLLSQDPDINQLTHFIFRVVNSKYLWKSFSQWLVLGKQLQQKIYNMFDFWNYGFKSINISIIGYEIAFDKQGSIHNLYLISLSNKKLNNSKHLNNKLQQPHKQYHIAPLYLKQDVTLKKRYNDFVKLDKNIKKYINQHNIKLNSIISLPPKFSPFGTKTSPKSRQIYLDMYLNEVIKIESISIYFIYLQVLDYKYEDHCVKFLQFLQVDLGRFRDQFQKIDQQKLASQNISSLVMDQLVDRL